MVFHYHIFAQTLPFMFILMKWLFHLSHNADIPITTYYTCLLILVMLVYNYRVWLHISKAYIVEYYVIVILEVHPCLRLKQLGAQRMALGSRYLS